MTNDLGKIAPGQAQYTLCCTTAGGVVDDLIAYLHADDDVLLVPNAANTAEVVRRLQAQAPEGVVVTNTHETTRCWPSRATTATRSSRRSACPPATTTCLSRSRLRRNAGRRVPHRLHG